MNDDKTVKIKIIVSYGDFHGTYESSAEVDPGDEIYELAKNIVEHGAAIAAVKLANAIEDGEK